MPLRSDGSNPVDAFADGIISRASTKYGALYGGVAAVHNGRDLNVYLTDATPQIESAIRGTAPTDHIHFIRTPNSLETLLTLRTQILRDLPTLKAQGINIVGWGPDTWTGKERLQVENITSSSSTILADRYGSSRIEIENTVSQTAATATTTRLIDTRPWNAGDFIQGTDPYQSGYVNNCTSGFGAHSGSNYYLLGAQHCYAAGTTITQNTSYAIGASGATIGSVYAVDDNYGGIDAETIFTPNDLLYPTVGNPGSSPAIFTGGSTNPQIADVSGSVTSPVGYQICEDGAYEGEICGLVVQLANQCISITEAPNVVRYACQEDEATNTSGGLANGQGDSGSGVFRFNGSLLEATGIDSAAANGTNVACQAYATNGRMCFSSIYYTEVQPILNEWGLQLNT